MMHRNLRSALLSACLLPLAAAFSAVAAPQMEAQAPKAAPGQTGNRPVRVRAKLDGFDIAPQSGRAPNQIGGASRGIGGLTLYAPKMGKAYSLTPSFFWSDDAQSTSVFRLAELSSSQSPIFEQKVTTSPTRPMPRR